MKPNINVTPLIDVLLVLLIIFMVISPAKPTHFETNVPSPPKTDAGMNQNPNTLIVTVQANGSFRLNLDSEAGAVDDPRLLSEKLADVFRFREQNGIFRENTNEIEKTVFISAPTSLDYGTVVRAVDAVKGAGADPVGLKVDKPN